MIDNIILVSEDQNLEFTKFQRKDIANLTPSDKNILIVKEEFKKSTIEYFLSQINTNKSFQAKTFEKAIGNSSKVDDYQLRNIFFYPNFKDLKYGSQLESIVIPDYKHEILKPALFLDRDGIINVNTHYPHVADELILIDDIIPITKHFYAQDYEIIVTTNQSGIGRGYFKEQDYQECCERIDQFFSKNDLTIKAWYHSPYIKGGIEGYNFESLLRKPEPGMFLLAAKEHGIDLQKSVMIGDSLTDQISDIDLKCYIVGEKSPNGLTLKNLLDNL